MNLILIRHGKTAGNLEKRYLGTTDEGLCPQGRQALSEGMARGRYPFLTKLPGNTVLWGSPMRRCRETAGLLFPHMEYHTEPDLKECDFGRFEYKNYLELSGSADYQAWVDSGGTLPFPGGEDPADFRRRCCRGFEKILDMCKGRDAGENGDVPTLILVVHGGTIMSVMSAYAAEKRDYFDWQPENGGGYWCRLSERRLHILHSF